MLKTLMIGPHMDDEAISCGGLLLKQANTGTTTVLAVHGRNYPDSTQLQRDSDKEECRDFLAACALLGAAPLSLLLPEGEPYSLGYYKLLARIEEMLRVYDPEQVLIPSASDLNQDHRHLNHICQIALRATNLRRVKRVLEFHGLDAQLRKPNFYVPLAASQLELKQRAINCYRRERRSIPSPRAPENVEAQARVWGSACGHEFAEAYTVVFWRD